MKNWQKLLAVFAIFMLTCSTVFAQAQIKGKVSDENGSPLPGVNIVIEGTTTGVVTNIDGLFSIQASVGQKLMIRFIGMKPQTLEISNTNTFLDVTLKNEATELDEMVIVGYGTQKKESIVGSIGTARAEDLIQQGNVSNMTDALTGLINGVTVLSVSGMPGMDDETEAKARQSEILVRGKTTWNNSGPLILVDGIERTMNDIDINEVETVSVLKDASATAVFGVKGGNGVILITTKRGKQGKAQFTIEAEISMETPAKMIETVDMGDASVARNIAIERTRRLSPRSWDLYTSDEEVGYYRNNTYPYAYQNLDWSDILLKDFAMSHRINMSARGGTEKVKYFASASYNHVGDIMNSEDVGQGYLPSFAYDRLNIRSNFDFELTKTTALRANFAAMYGVRNTPPGTSQEGLFGGLLFQSGDAPILQYEDGIYGSQDPQFFAFNSYQKLNLSGARSEPRTIINMDFTFDQDLKFITKGLGFSAKLAFDNTFRNKGRSVNEPGMPTKKINKDFYLEGGFYDNETETYMLDGQAADMAKYTDWEYPVKGGEGFDFVREAITYGNESVSLNKADRSLYYELKLNYARTFGSHGLTAMAIFSRQENERGSNWPRKREDWVGRITYDYGHRYFLEINGAYNGSEKFGPEYRFDFFPSVAAGWMISNEQFMKDNVSWIDELKLRYSFGMVGNDNVNAGQWPYATIWNTYSFGDIEHIEDTYYGYPYTYQELNKYNEGNPGNPYLHWEKAKKQNLGLELGILNNKINLTADIFNENRTDMLLGADERSVPPLFGKPIPPASIGEAKSRGAEIEITYRDKINSLNYWVTANWSVARSEVIYKETPPLVEEHQRPEGKPIGFTRTAISDGFIESWDDFYGYPPHANTTNTGLLLPGDMVLVDYNSDGRYNGSDDDAPYGYPMYPQNSYGLNAGANYKGFELSLRFLGSYNVTRRIADNLFYRDNLFVPTYLLEDTWSPEFNNEDPTYPALILYERRNRYNPSGSYNYFDGSFLRLQSAQIGYSLPNRLTKPLGIQNLKLYVNGRNLFLWTKMPNDGVGMSVGKNYPTKKQINFGINVRF